VIRSGRFVPAGAQRLAMHRDRPACAR